MQMSTPTPNQSQTRASLHPDTHMGLLSLTVGDLVKQLAFYRDVMGFALLSENKGHAVLGVGTTPLLVLHELPGAPAFPPNATGLYHFAILLPTRADLGRWLLHLVESGYPLSGASDHLVSEALYLSDPEGNGIEVYRDRAREEWPRRDGAIQMATDPLDLRALVNEVQAEPHAWQGLPEGTRLGHMHLQVADIPTARRFYSEVLGFDVVVDMERWGALFVSAGGYHHHLGLNTWQSRGGRPAPEGSGGLRYFTIVLPDAEALASVLARLQAEGVPYREENGSVVFEDPWRNQVVLTTGTSVPADASSTSSAQAS